MSLALSTLERVARARADLRIGAPAAVRAGGAGDPGGAVILAVETTTPARAQALGALGPVDLALTARRAETLRARAYDGDLARVAVDDLSDFARIAAAANPALALAAPLMGPFRTRREGSAAAHRLALKLCKQARLLPAALAAPVADVETLARANGLTLIGPEDVAAAEEASARLAPVSVARVPLDVAENARVHVFRPEDGAEEHYAIEIGAPSRRAPVLSRLHSACFTGDVAGSLKCDCGPQLSAALSQIGAEGGGVLLYLNQEGRGIGLANKLRAYALQEAGFDTVEANHRLGFEDDERDFRIGAAILRGLGFDAVRLMTNNPGKTAAMAGCGVAVAERVPLKVGLNPLNAGYLATKRAKSGHLL